MSFQWPFCLLLLLFVPLACVFYVLTQRRRRAYAIRFTNLALLESVVSKSPGRRRHIPPLLFVLALTAFLVSMARPSAVIAIPRDNASVVLVIDTSGSMAAQDMQPTRLMAARQAAHDFINALPSHFQVGLISFNGVVTVRSPLTHDYTVVQRAIDTLVPGGGTAIGDGLEAALDMLNPTLTAGGAADKNAPPATVILLSDGQNNMGSDPALAMTRAHNVHVKINTIGIGARGIVTTVEGNQEVGLNEDALRNIATFTGGRYFYAAATGTLRQIYTNLSTEISWIREATDITLPVSAAGVLLFLVAGILSLRWFQRVL